MRVMTEEIGSLISKIDSLLLLDKHLREANRDFMKPEASLELVEEIEKLLNATHQRAKAFYNEIRKLGQQVANDPNSSRCDQVTANNLNTIEQDMEELNALVAHIINYEKDTPTITAELKQGFANVGQAYANVCIEYVRFINLMVAIPNAIYSGKDYNKTKLGSLIADKKIEDYKQQLLRNGQQVNNVLGENNNG